MWATEKVTCFTGLSHVYQKRRMAEFPVMCGCKGGLISHLFSNIHTAPMNVAQKSSQNLALKKKKKIYCIGTMQNLILFSFNSMWIIQGCNSAHAKDRGLDPQSPTVKSKMTLMCTGPWSYSQSRFRHRKRKFEIDKFIYIFSSV